MVCPSCGHEVSEGANFCLNCGAKLEMEAAETQAPIEQVSQGAETQTQDQKQSTASKAMSNAPFNVLSIAGLAVSCLSLVLASMDSQELLASYFLYSDTVKLSILRSGESHWL